MANRNTVYTLSNYLSRIIRLLVVIEMKTDCQTVFNNHSNIFIQIIITKYNKLLYPAKKGDYIKYDLSTKKSRLKAYRQFNYLLQDLQEIYNEQLNN